MINIIFAIPFLGAFLYYFAANRIKSRCLRTLTKEEKEELGFQDYEDEEVKMFDATAAGRWLAVMSVCWFVGYPIIQLQKWLGL